jgi:hypothetical protein
MIEFSLVVLAKLRSQLMAPAEPELWKSVSEQHEWLIIRSIDNAMESSVESVNVKLGHRLTKYRTGLKFHFRGPSIGPY